MALQSGVLATVQPLSPVRQTLPVQDCFAGWPISCQGAGVFNSHLLELLLSCPAGWRIMYRRTPRAAATQPEAAAHPAAEGPPPAPQVQAEPVSTPDQQPEGAPASPTLEAEAEPERREAPEGEIQVITGCFRDWNALHQQLLLWGGLMSHHLWA